ncbi:MAG: ABC transporter ATP-binding protein/permease [Candidatus Nomurabacteria bacterium]|jgi:ATP-binding cassette subfamily B protein/ATP-binding cassette subfamily C protein|nr:ABC transporter ATP-binding protein/permease [Candidatus Nomurabacteria bacterium]
MPKPNKVNPRVALRATAYSVRMMFRSNPLAAIFISAVEIIQAPIPSVQAIFTGVILTKLAAGDWNGFLLFIGLLVALSILRTILQHVNGYFSQVLQYDIHNYANEQLYLKVNRISIAARETKENADKLEIAERYALSLGWLFPRLLAIMSQSIAFAVAVAVLASLSWPIALVIVLTMIPNSVLMIQKMRMERKIWKSNSVHRRKGWGIRSQLTDQKQTIELRVNGLYNYFVRQWRKHIVQDRVEEMAAERKFLPWEMASGSLQSLATLGVLAWAGKLIIDGKLEIGYLMTIKSLMDNLMSSAFQVVSSLSQVGSDIMNASDYFAYLDLPEEVDGEVLVAADKPPKIEFRDVTFTYPLGEQPVIKNVSFTINTGEAVALVGENGSGKTTIIKLLFGLYPPDSGEILVNDVPLSKINKVSYYKHLGALFQDYSRYTFTNFTENIWYGDITRKLNKKEILEVVDKAKLTPLVNKLPFGMSQILSKRFDDKNGTDLSGGQWQRVALARSFWRNPNVLILDEPTAAVDAKAEYEIFQEIAKSQHGKTTIIISHRFSTVRKAEKILVIDSGRIIEQGSHRQLMALEKGLYREMFELQAEGYLD